MEGAVTDPPLVRTLAPLLVVANVEAAVAFYIESLGAREVARFRGKNGVVVHVDLALNDSPFAVMVEAPTFHNHAPPSLGGSPVVLRLRTTNVDVAIERATDGGAILLLGPLDFAGERMARVRDPFGHLWLFVQPLEALSAEETQRRRDAFTPPER